MNIHYLMVRFFKICTPRTKFSRMGVTGMTSIHVWGIHTHFGRKERLRKFSSLRPGTHHLEVLKC